MLRIRTIGKKVLVERLAEQEETQGGLFLPSAARERPQLGRIIAHRYPEPTVEPFGVGCLVMFPKFHDRTVVIDNRELLVLDEDELLALIEED